MKSVLFTIVAVVALPTVGCEQTAEDRIAGWTEMGMWLPEESEVRFFSDNFDSAKVPLIAALSHPDESVRMRAAYVIEKIGVRAKAVGPHLLSQLENDKSRLVRMYLIDALVLIEYDKDAVVAVLTKQFNSLDPTNIPPREDGSYAEVDEKIAIAASLYVVTSGEKKAEYRQFVSKWLKPPASNMSDELLAGYWKRRWVAVTSLVQMPGAVEAVPLLEALRNEPNAKPWVEHHVPRALAVLRTDTK